MKLMLYDVDYNDETYFEDGYVISVECKDKIYFNRLIGGLKGFNENRIALIEKDERVDLAKDGLVVIDYFSLSQYEKAILTKLYKQLEKIYGNEPEVVDNMQTVYNSLNSIINGVVDGYNVDFEVEVPISLTEYLKFVSLKPKSGFDYGIEGITNFISLIASLKLYKIIVFVNAKSFFTKEQIEEIYKTCCYNGQNTLFLDNCEFEERYKNEMKIVVDEDYYDVLYKE